MRLSQRYTGVVWLERLGSDTPAGTRVVPELGSGTIPVMVERLDSAFGVEVEIASEGPLWRLRCVPCGDKMRRLGSRIGASYLAVDIVDAFRAAIMDYEELQSGAYLGVFGAQPVERKVRCS